MAKSLKHSSEGLLEAFEHHLVYEVNMLRHTYIFLSVLAWSPELANTIIESFCVHARTLIDFFSEKSETPGQAKSDYVGAKHFCDKQYEPWTKGEPSKDLIGQLNQQISHLTYDRTKDEKEKVGPQERLELLKLIEAELDIFGAHLRDSYASKWPFKTDGASATIIKMGSAYGPSTEVRTVSTSNLGRDSYGWTGPAAPTLKITDE